MTTTLPLGCPRPVAKVAKELATSLFVILQRSPGATFRALVMTRHWLG